MNQLENIRDVLKNSDQEVLVDEGIRRKAVRSLDRMLNFRKPVSAA